MAGAAAVFARTNFTFFSCRCSILKSIEFPAANTPDEEDEKSTDKANTKPLEVLLLERNKALQSENTALKVANTDLQGKWSLFQSVAQTPTNTRNVPVNC